MFFFTTLPCVLTCPHFFSSFANVDLVDKGEITKRTTCASTRKSCVAFTMSDDIWYVRDFFRNLGTFWCLPIQNCGVVWLVSPVVRTEHARFAPLLTRTGFILISAGFHHQVPFTLAICSHNHPPAPVHHTSRGSAALVSFVARCMLVLQYEGDLCCKGLAGGVRCWSC